MGKNLNQLTQFDIRNGIKNNWDMETFCDKYSCTEKEFPGRISKLYKYKADEVISDIKSVKKHAKKKKGEPEAVETEIATVAEVAVDAVEIAETEVESVEIKTEDAEVEAKSVAPDAVNRTPFSRQCA